MAKGNSASSVPSSNKPTFGTKKSGEGKKSFGPKAQKPKQHRGQGR